MEWVDHVDIHEVGSSSFVGDVDRVLEREVPHREGLELGISSRDAALMLVVELRQTHSHLSAARTRSSDDDERTSCLHIVVLAEAFVRVDEGNVLWIAVDGVVIVSLDAETLQTLAVCIGTALAIVVGDHHAAHEEASADELLAQAQNVLVVGDAKVLTHLVLLDVLGTDHNHYLCLVCKLLQHAELAVGHEAREHAACVMVVEELASEFKIELVAKLRDSFLDMFRLDL